MMLGNRKHQLHCSSPAIRLLTTQGRRNPTRKLTRSPILSRQVITYQALLPTLNWVHLFQGLDDEKLDEFFHIDETVRWIRENNYKRVALQLPDHFLVRAARIAQLIEAKAEAKIFILADTSYRRQVMSLREAAICHAFQLAWKVSMFISHCCWRWQNR